jgi:hypothetical protein
MIRKAGFVAMNQAAQIVQQPTHPLHNTVLGASLGMLGAALAHEHFKDPFLTAVVAGATGALGAYLGSCADEEAARQAAFFQFQQQQQHYGNW